MIDIQNFNLGTFAMKTTAPENVVKRLLDDGTRLKDSYNHKLAGHLKSQFLYERETAVWFYQTMQDYWSCYREQHALFHGLENKKINLHAADLWVNFMKPGDFNPVHTHGGDITFVLYLDVPKELEKEQDEFVGNSSPPGYLEFQFTQLQKDRWFTNCVEMKPETGMLVVFPAQLQHWVMPFKSNVTRISVSGNLSIEKEDKKNDYF
jgi:uncharacterized protein (TIGR02466 family)